MIAADSDRSKKLLIGALLVSALNACSSEPESGASRPGTAGAGASGSTGASGGSAGHSGSGGGSSAGSAGAGNGGSGGFGGSSAGTGGNLAGGAGVGGAAGAGGASAGAGGADDTSPTATATITGLNGATVAGTATFTQEDETVTLVLELTGCPDGVHASHLHENKSCAEDGAAAGGHWVPNGEGLGDYTCTDGAVTYSVSRPTTTWTVGDGGPNDVTGFSFMVHEAGEPAPGGRIGCGVIDQP